MADLREFYSLAAASEKWGYPISTIIGWAAAGRLRLCTGIAYADADGAPMAGLVEIAGADIMSAFRLNSAPPELVRAFRLRMFGVDSDWRFVTDIRGERGVEIAVADVCITTDDLDTFQDENGLAPARERVVYRRTSAVDKHDWPEMYSQLCCRIFEHGLPDHLRELTLEMLQGFVDRSEDGGAPDESTVRKRLQPIWGELMDIRNKHPKVVKNWDACGYDWDTFYVEVIARVHEEGIPASQGEMLRQAQNWWAMQDPEGGPGETTLLRRIRPIWQRLRGDAGALTAAE